MAHEPRKVVIVGAAGRDFHNFNVAFRDDDAVRVVAFTGTQIPGISDRVYPPELAGARYPQAASKLFRCLLDANPDEVDSLADVAALVT